MTTTTLPIVSPARRIAFYILVGLFALFLIAVFFFLNPVNYPVWLILGWFNPESLNLHQLHNMIGGAADWVFLAGIILQFHKPERKVAGLQMVALMTLSSVIQNIFDGGFTPALLIFPAIVSGIALLHPARRDMLRFGRPGNPELLALVGLAAVPMLYHVVNQMNLQLTAGDEHAQLLHYSSMANITFDIILLGLLASFKTPGWRIPAWSAGFVTIILGLISVLFPEQASSIGRMWGILAIVWGLAFIGVAEWKQLQERET